MDIVDDLIEIYDCPLAHRLYDELVTEREHALQCAALAEGAGAGIELVAAALLHDLGHLLLDDNVALDVELTTDREHDKMGARYLARWFPASVTGPIALHVQAKRYLCAREPEYLAALSPSSVRSLRVQGGPMSNAEAETFAQHPASEQAIAVRRWDDLGKIEGLEIPDFGYYAAMLQTLVSTR
jgi:phosphonate degradation associated HDIG domain protein